MFATTKLAFNYSILALISTAANIGTQDLAIRVYHGPFGILASAVTGTGIGLVIKYMLDKRYIFRFRARSALHDTSTFLLYATMGLATTMVFWCFEFGFNYIFEDKAMRYLGGIIGLSIGYIAKYHLDKRYVFGLKAS